MHLSTLILWGEALTLVKASYFSKSQSSSQNKIQQRKDSSVQNLNTPPSSLTPDTARPTVTETVTVVEITISKACSAPTYATFAETGLFFVSSPSARTIFPPASKVVYNTSYTVPVETITTSAATIFSLPMLTSVEPEISGILNTDLGEPGQPTSNPLLTKSIPTRSSLPTFTPTQALSTVAPFPFPNSTNPGIGRNQTQPTEPNPAQQKFNQTQPTGPTKPEEEPNPIQQKFNSTGMARGDIFSAPIDIKALPRQFTSRPDHPVPRTGIQTKGPLQTNKFYSNLFLGNQRDPVYTFPYSVSWVGGTGVSGSHGFACSHVDEKQRLFGPPKFNVQASYYINPIGIQSMIISALELGDDTKLTLDSMTSFSVRAQLSSNLSSEPAVTFPLVQGMAYITAEYNGATPLIQTGVFFRNVTRATKQPKKNVTKYTFVLEDGATWRVYGYKTKGDDLDLQVLNNGVASSAKPFYGIIQVVKEAMTNDSGEGSDLLDQGAGVYAKTVDLSGTADDATGSYSFDFKRAGHTDGDLLMFALPHHVQSFDQATSGRQVKGGSLLTTTKGSATLVQGSKWTMVEPAMPVKLGFDPYHAEKGSLNKLSTEAKATISAAASKEILQDMIAATDLNSMYWSGKALAKFAFLLYVVNDMLGDTKLAQTGLGQLKVAFARFADNKQQYPLVHETAWGGVVSLGAYETGQALEDFGNTYYNDHHFHYGYHILTAAVIGHLDKSWIAKNKDYVNMLARDTSNPSSKDSIFPVWRSFDWYHGHSWATGLFASLDGKNQESTSEDMMHAYGLKMWGQVTGNAPLEARSNLQLAVAARSLQNYFLYEKDNKVQPDKFIGNKVSGILFENKVDHTTFFGNEIESIQGIHMIPILPVTTVARKSKFVTEEWDSFFSNGRVDDINNSWKSILLGNYATVAPKEAFEVLSGKEFDSAKWLDGGISLTWLLAYSAALGEL